MGYTVVLHKNNSWLEKGKENYCQKPLSSCTAKQVLVSFLKRRFTPIGSNRSGLLIKWKQIVAPYFFAVSRSRVLTAQRGSLKLICWFFFIHTGSFNLGHLNWHGKGKSLRAPGQIFAVDLQPHQTLSACQKAAPHSPYLFQGDLRDGILQPKPFRSPKVY